jgi:hypothetical protein
MMMIDDDDDDDDDDGGGGGGGGDDPNKTDRLILIHSIKKSYVKWVCIHMNINGVYSMEQAVSDS